MKIEYIVKNKLIFLFTCFKNDKIINIILENLKQEYGDIFDSEYKKILLNKKFWIWLKQERIKYKNDEIYYFNKFSNYYSNFTKL